MVVCHCRAVTDRTICAAIVEGARDRGSLVERCGAGSGCGGCWPTLEGLLAQCGPAGALQGDPTGV